MAGVFPLASADFGAGPSNLVTAAMNFRREKESLSCVYWRLRTGNDELRMQLLGGKEPNGFQCQPWNEILGQPLGSTYTWPSSYLEGHLLQTLLHLVMVPSVGSATENTRLPPGGLRVHASFTVLSYLITRKPSGHYLSWLFKTSPSAWKDLFNATVHKGLCANKGTLWEAGFDGAFWHLSIMCLISVGKLHRDQDTTITGLSKEEAKSHAWLAGGKRGGR